MPEHTPSPSKRSNAAQSPRALILDLDGTLVPPNASQVSPTVTQLVRAIASAIPVAIATGRDKPEVMRFAAQFNLTAPQIADNGSRIFSPDTGKDLHASILEPQTYKALVSHPEVARHGFFPRTDPADPTILSVTMGNNEKAAADLAARLAAQFGLSCELSRGAFREFYIVVTNTGVHKGYGVSQLASILNIDLHHFMAIGDGLNDISMFNAVGMPVAVAGAHPRAQAAAGTQLAGGGAGGNGLEQFLQDLARRLQQAP